MVLGHDEIQHLRKGGADRLLGFLVIHESSKRLQVVCAVAPEPTDSIDFDQATVLDRSRGAVGESGLETDGHTTAVWHQLIAADHRGSKQPCTRSGLFVQQLGRLLRS